MKTLPMPTLTADQVSVCNQLIGRHRDLSLAIGDAAFGLRFTLAPAAPTTDRRSAQTIHLDVGRFSARVDLSWVGDFAPLSDLLGDTNLADLPPEVQTAVIATLLEPALDQLAEALGEDVSLGQTESPHGPDDAAVRIGFSLTCDGRPAAHGSIAFSTELVPTVLDLADRSPAVACNDLSDVPVAAAVEVGNVSLSLRQLLAIAPFDVVLMDATTREEDGQSVRLALAPAMVCRAKLEESCLMIEEIEPWAPREPWEDDSVVAAEDVPVELTFDVGQLRLPLAEWAELRSGSIAPFAKREDQLLWVLAAGRTIGRAEPVRLGDRFGARLLEWTAKPDMFPKPEAATDHAEHDQTPEETSAEDDVTVPI